MNKIKIKIPSETSLYINKLYYEYQISLNIISFLMSQDNINNDKLQEFIKKTTEKGIELEEAKKAVASEYLPNEGKNTFCYSFDFGEESIIYDTKIQ